MKKKRKKNKGEGLGLGGVSYTPPPPPNLKLVWGLGGGGYPLPLPPPERETSLEGGGCPVRATFRPKHGVWDFSKFSFFKKKKKEIFRPRKKPQNDTHIIVIVFENII